MDINFLKLFQKESNLTVTNINRLKRTCVLFLGNNIDLHGAISKLHLNMTNVRTIIIPSLRKPIKTKTDPKYSQSLANLGYKIINGSIADINDKISDNIIMDSSIFIDKTNSKYDILNNSKKSLNVISSLMNEFSSIRKEYQKVLLYVSSEKITDVTKSTFYPIYINVLRNRFNQTSIPFEKIVFFDGENYTLIYDKNINTDLQQFKEFFNMKETKLNNLPKSKHYYEDENDKIKNNLNNFRKNSREKYFGQFKDKIEESMMTSLGNLGLNAVMTGGANYMSPENTAAGIAQRSRALMIKSKIANNVGKIGTAAVAGATALGAGAAISSKISEIMKNRDWQKNGCKNIKDQNRKTQCEIYLKNKTINDLKSLETQCRDEECKQRIQSKLQGLL